MMPCDHESGAQPRPCSLVCTKPCGRYQVLLNVTRECSGTPSPECLRVALPEACVLLMTDGCAILQVGT